MADLICRDCQVAAKGVHVEGCPDVARCPRCGYEMELEEALRLAGEYLASQVADELQAGLARNFRGVEGVDFVPDKPQRRSAPRFVAR